VITTARCALRRLVFAAAFVGAAGCVTTEPSKTLVRSPTGAELITAIADHEPLPARTKPLLAQLRPAKARAGGPTVARACESGKNALELESTAAFDQKNARWIVIDVQRELSEPPRIAWAGFVSTTQSREETSKRGKRAARERSRTSLCRAIAGDPNVIETPNLIDASALESYATGGASSLVRFDSWLLYANPSESGDDELHLFKPDGREHNVIARKAGLVGPFDAGSCRTGSPSDFGCTPMRAYLGITAVRLAPDGRTLLVQGYAGPPDHEHSGSFHWVVELAER
jgi:hypothetical protein